jgi:hypothetical protein
MVIAVLLSQSGAACESACERQSNGAGSWSKAEAQMNGAGQPPGADRIALRQPPWR